MSDLQQALYLIADEMRGMATVGKHYAANIYEVERAHRMMELAAKVAALAEERPAEEVREEFESEPWLRYSPAIGVEAAVFNEQGEILLIQRRDNAHWALPGGLAEIGHTFSEVALAELWEEAGMRGNVKRLLGVFDGRLWGSRIKVHIAHLIYLVECEDLQPNPGIECVDAGYFAPDRLPTPFHRGHELRVPKCFDLRFQETYIDPACSIGIPMPDSQRPAR